MGDGARRNTDKIRNAEKTLDELRTLLNKAYLSGDGAAVERAMAQLAEAEQTADRGQLASR